MKVLGLDTKSVGSGWAVVETDGENLKLIASGFFSLPAKLSHDARLCIFEDFVRATIRKYQVDLVTVEELQSVRGARTSRVLQMYITAAMMATWREMHKDARRIAPQSARSRVGANQKPLTAGLTGKEKRLFLKGQVQAQVNKIFHTNVTNDDIADAIAVALAGLAG